MNLEKFNSQDGKLAMLTKGDNNQAGAGTALCTSDETRQIVPNALLSLNERTSTLLNFPTSPALVMPLCLAGR